MLLNVKSKETQIKMGKNRSIDKWEWIAPAFIVIAILAIYLAMTYLPLGDWNIKFTASGLWVYMPWLVVFGVGLYALKRVWRQK